jgi:hypothetical protein
VTATGTACQIRRCSRVLLASMAEQLVEQHVQAFIWCTAFGRKRAHKLRRGCRSGALAVFCTASGTYRTDHDLSAEDQARITYYFLEGRWKRPEEGYYPPFLR